MSRPSRIIVVLEDGEHEMLIRRYLRKCGFGFYDMTFVRSPGGQGSAENWVRKTFITEMNVYRVRAARAQTALIAIVDADIRTVQERLAQLDQALRDSGQQPVEKREKIARLVPRRNVETWILGLNGRQVDEATDYKQVGDRWHRLIPEAADVLHKWTRPHAELPEDCIDSLRRGIEELKRLDF